MDNQDLLTRKFEEIGARVKFEIPRWGFNSDSNLAINIRKDKKGSYFSIAVKGDAIDLSIVDTNPGMRHLVLMSKEQREKAKYLCGHDERDWFVAALPEKRRVIDVESAMEALKPGIVVSMQETKKVKVKDKVKRKNIVYKRQGEWFFVPAPNAKIPEKLILINEPLQRGRAKPHIASNLYRQGGQRVYVSRSYPNGIPEKTHEAMMNADPTKTRREGFRFMLKDPIVHVRGSITHPDHKTVYLDVWHLVVPNTETQAKAMRNVAFLD